MGTVFSENEDHDLFLGSNKQLSISVDLIALIQAAKSAVEIQLGEAIYSQGVGVPNFDTVWNGSPNLQQFEFYARKQISNVVGVIEVKEFDAQIDDDTVNYQATISTIYGETGLDGSL